MGSVRFTGRASGWGCAKGRRPRRRQRGEVESLLPAPDSGEKDLRGPMGGAQLCSSSSPAMMDDGPIIIACTHAWTSQLRWPSLVGLDFWRWKVHHQKGCVALCPVLVLPPEERGRSWMNPLRRLAWSSSGLHAVITAEAETMSLSVWALCCWLIVIVVSWLSEQPKAAVSLEFNLLLRTGLLLGH